MNQSQEYCEHIREEKGDNKAELKDGERRITTGPLDTAIPEALGSLTSQKSIYVYARMNSVSLQRDA